MLGSSSKSGSKVAVALDEVVGLDGLEFFFEIEGEDEDSAVGIRDPSSVGLPGVVSESSYGFTELCSDQDQSITDAITVLVEGSCFEVMF